MNILGHFEINKVGDVVLGGESGHELVFMLEDAPFKIVCDACIKGARCVGQDVDVLLPFHTSLPEA